MPTYLPLPFALCLFPPSLFPFPSALFSPRAHLPATPTLPTRTSTPPNDTSESKASKASRKRPMNQRVPRALPLQRLQKLGPRRSSPVFILAPVLILGTVTRARDRN
ncbi:hypothetical protein GALMADRAFT_260048 [Galerina marginata CBS 339.88]|uniref:Uncharacterized protein n=1 Tax=Galerina marginata (strain CBS 339.88) TaxID=685588 RepID=A0A067S7G8_GALM3|nr:hypothetical protein GALMADRAFT_260048 [Galerina marginata CBS 339.88]